jgi:cysteinyl-tRNA synthetase
MSRFGEAMDDDFNTAGALGHLFDFIRKINRWLSSDPDLGSGAHRSLAEGARDRILQAGSVLGVFHEQAESFFVALRARRLDWLGMDEAEIQAAIERRLEARSNKDFSTADAIRDELAERGIGLKDDPTGTSWTVQRGLTPQG